VTRGGDRGGVYKGIAISRSFAKERYGSHRHVRGQSSFEENARDEMTRGSASFKKSEGRAKDTSKRSTPGENQMGSDEALGGRGGGGETRIFSKRVKEPV